MVAYPQAYAQQFIERAYPSQELVTASPGRRLGGYLLDAVLLIATLGIGWLIWFIFTAQDGQTPAKKLLGMYVMKSDGTRAGGGYTWLREFVVKGLVTGLINFITFGIYTLLASLWCTWDKDRQCLWDKMSGTYVAWSPNGFKPLTSNERQASGLSMPLIAPVVPVAVTPAGATISDQLRDLTRLRDEGVLTQDEYEERRKRLVDQL